MVQGTARRSKGPAQGFRHRLARLWRRSSSSRTRCSGTSSNKVSTTAAVATAAGVIACAGLQRALEFTYPFALTANPRALLVPFLFLSACLHANIIPYTHFAHWLTSSHPARSCLCPAGYVMLKRAEASQRRRPGFFARLLGARTAEESIAGGEGSSSSSTGGGRAESSADRFVDPLTRFGGVSFPSQDI